MGTFKTISAGSKDVVGIRSIKSMLNLMIGTKLDCTNDIYGPTTTAAVKIFQTRNNLNPDGAVGELTWNKLFNIYPPVSDKISDLSERALAVFKTYLGIREATGNNDGPLVEKILASVGLPKGYAYCMATIYYVYKVASEQLGVKNPIVQTAGALDFYNRMPASTKVKVPRSGDIGIMDFGGGKGHAFMIRANIGNGRVTTYEGNTSPQLVSAKLDRDGGGFWERNRSITSINKGFIRI